MSDLIKRLRRDAEWNEAVYEDAPSIVDTAKREREAADALEANAKRIAELEAECERLRVDAERYAYLAKTIDPCEIPIDFPCDYEVLGDSEYMRQFNASIDNLRAMKP